MRGRSIEKLGRVPAPSYFYWTSIFKRQISSWLSIYKFLNAKNEKKNNLLLIPNLDITCTALDKQIIFSMP